MKSRASSAYSIMAGSHGLTEAQQRNLNELMMKIKLTEKQAETRDELTKKRDAPIELTAGAKSFVEDMVDAEVWQYTKSFSNYKTQKGTMCEDESIGIVNSLWFTNFVKSDEELSTEFWTGHPDIVDYDNEMIIDIKTATDKRSFIKHYKNPVDLQYEWQVKCYLYMKGWTKGKVVYVLVDTPEELIPSYEDLSLHECGDLPLDLRVASFDVELTEEDKKMFDVKGKLASDYYNEYKSKFNV